MKTFEELGVAAPILKAIQEMGYESPMPVQEEVIPFLLGEDNDVIALAQTGTGKTAAYGLPILQKINVSQYQPQALILCPTRELCLQIADDLNDYSKYIDNLKVLPVYGGSSIESQIKTLKRGVHVVVATPGRLIDLMNRKTVDLSNVKNVILDEADEMLNMGFIEDVEAILAESNDYRRILLFSATMPAKIQQLAKTILQNPVEVKLAVSKPAEKIIQAAYICYEAQKLGIIESLFSQQKPERVIIFASSKLKVKEVAKSLKRMNLNVGEMHSDLEQNQRDAIMHEFRNGRISMLVATDIVARGIDIDDIRLVINYDVPNDSEDYVHRIGRTARANNDGCAITFVSQKEQPQFKAIENFLGRNIYKIPVPEELGEAPEYNPRSGAGRSNHKGGGSRRQGNYKGKKNGTGKPNANNRRNTPKE